MDEGYSLRIKALLDTASIKGQLKTLGEKQTVRINTNGEQVVRTAKQMEDSFGKVHTAVDEINTSTGKVTGSITSTSKASERLSQKFTTILTKVFKFGAATAVIGGVTTAFYKAVQAIEDYDNALTQYRKVSNLSGKELQEYGVKLGKMGESVAKSRTQMIEAATLYKQAGYSDEDSARLAKVSALYQNIADEELSASDASAVIVSQMKAFNISAKNSVHVIDAIYL